MLPTVARGVAPAAALAAALAAAEYRGAMARAHVEPDEAPRARLSDGTVARIVPSRFAAGFELVVDATPQSHVDLDDPTHLHFEYVARMGAVIDRLRMPGQPLTAVHLGAGALTIPRYVEATRPGSRQQVIEREPELVALVREHLPLPRRAAIRTRIGDAREGLARLPAALRGNVDLLVSDVFAGAQTPAHLTTIEFYTEAAALLAPDGVLLVNVADGSGLAHARRQVATVRAVLEHVVVLAEVQVLKGRRFGNLIIAASPSPLPTAWLPRLMAAGPHPAKVSHGAELEEFARSSRPVTDADASPSPLPSASLFGR
jgi:spermidine synthase